LAIYPLSAFRAMSAAALTVYGVLRSAGTQRDVVPLMQTRRELYDFLRYDAYERKLDQLFAREYPADETS
jgi:methylisocitrate lyase